MRSRGIWLTMALDTGKPDSTGCARTGSEGSLSSCFLNTRHLEEKGRQAAGPCALVREGLPFPSCSPGLLPGVSTTPSKTLQRLSLLGRSCRAKGQEASPLTPGPHSSRVTEVGSLFLAQFSLTEPAAEPRCPEDNLPPARAHSFARQGRQTHCSTSKH